MNKLPCKIVMFFDKKNCIVYISLFSSSDWVLFSFSFYLAIGYVCGGDGSWQVSL